MPISGVIVPNTGEPAQLETILTELRRNNCEPDMEGVLDAAAGDLNLWFTGFQQFSRNNFSGDVMLIVTELAEAVEADRKDLPSEVCPGLSGVEEEIADALVRLLHLCGKYGLRIGEAYARKMEVNFARPVKHGKAY